MHLRGQISGNGPAHDIRPELALLAAILLQAIRDARKGDHDAAGWLAQQGAALADVFFDIAPDVWAGWAGSSARVYRPRDKAPMTCAERSRRRDAKKKAARLAQCG